MKFSHKNITSILGVLVLVVCYQNCKLQSSPITSQFPGEPSGNEVATTPESNGIPLPACSDNKDNDNDGNIDFPDDIGCASSADNSELDVSSSPNGKVSFSDFSPSDDTSIIYVSDSLGQDDECQAYPANQIANAFAPPASVVPCKTLSSAVLKYHELPNNEPHWILFKSGDTWTNQNFGKWKKSGRSKSEPALLASYGGSNQPPTILTGSSSFSGSIANGVKFVTLADLFIQAHTATPETASAAFRWISDSPAGQWVFEGLMVQNFAKAFLIGASQPPYAGSISNVSFRLNKIYRNFEDAVYISGVYGLKLFEGNIFYQNAYFDSLNEGSFRGKHLYLDNENGYPGNGDPTGLAIYRDNFFVDAAAYAFHARTGGEIINNYVENNGFGIVIGSHDGGQLWPSISVNVTNNVVVHLADSLHQPLGYGILIENAQAEVERNIIAYYDSAKNYGYPFQITGDAGNQTLARLVNNTIYDVVGNIRKGGDVAPIVYSDNLINADMTLAPTSVRSSSVSFVDSDLRDLAKYNMERLGGDRSSHAFMLEALKQWRGYYRNDYSVNAVNDYVREGFQPDGSQPDICGKGAVACK